VNDAGSDQDLRSEGFRDAAFHLERPGADLYVEVVGRSGGAVVFYLHGGPGGSAHALREALGEELEAYVMIYADQRGGGRSYADEAFDLDTLASDVAAIARTLHAPPMILLAHGFGAVIAARVERNHPEVVAGHVWLNPWVSMPTLASTLHRRALTLSGGASDEGDGAGDGAGDPNALVDQAFGLVGAKPLLDDLTFPDAASRLRLEHLMTTALHGPERSATLDEPWWIDAQEDLPYLGTPLVALFATLDATATPDQAEVVLSALPHAMTTLLPGGHHTYLDDPEAFLAALATAVAHVEGSDRGRG
jgi:proline iminopeptidase